MAGGRRRRSSDGDGGAVVELGLRLWTGSSSGNLSAEAEASTAVAAAPTRSWMTILYGSRMCAVGVTQIQAMEIITMANQQLILTKQQHGSRRCHRDGQPDSSSSTTEQQPETLQRRRGSCSPPASSSPSSHPGLEAAALAKIGHAASTAPGLSMKRFLLKRKTRAAVGSPYARPTTH